MERVNVQMRSGRTLPEQRLHRPRLEEDLVDVVEVGEVGVDLDDPVRTAAPAAPSRCRRWTRAATGTAGS